MTEFKIGDKVKHRTFGPVVVCYGPYKSVTGAETYLVETSDGIHRGALPKTLSAVQKFAVGDEVKHDGAEYTGRIVAGPFTSYDAGFTMWVVERENGDHSVPSEDRLSKVTPEIKVGDRVRIVHAAPFQGKG
ncbi:hypothetical protein [Streptomyces tsukubensis]|uniref:hypothetical protein n=1 Tax=Streptomyces tsukubensis TaxID=83656 RepID=UPI00344C3572